MAEIAAIFERFWQLRRLMLLAVLIGLLAGLLTIFRPTSDAPFLESRSFTRGVALAQVLIDSERSALTNVTYDIAALSSRAQIFVQLVGTDEVRQQITRELGIEQSRLAIIPVVARVAGVPARNPTAGERNGELAQELLGYRLEVRAAGDLPILELSAQAPTPQEAGRLANAAAQSTIQYLERLGAVEAEANDAAPPERSALSEADLQAIAFGEVRFRQLGAAEAAEIQTGGGIATGVVVGLATFLISAVVIFFLAGLVRELRARRRTTVTAPAASVEA
jgi:hypothetical protein